MKAFARVTEVHDAIALTLTPCAGQLHRYLLRELPAGKQQELELEAFSDWSSEYRYRPYSIRHIQRALQELLSVGLVNIVRRYTARIYKLICFHPGQDKNVTKLDEKVQSRTEMSKIEPSNPYACVPSYRESRETTDIHHPFHPVLNSGTHKEKVTNSTQHPNLEKTESGMEMDPPTNPNSQNVPLSSEEIKIDVELQAEIEETISPQPLNQNIRKVVLDSTVAVVKDALAVVRQQKNAGKAKRPAGLLVRAIQERWTPNPVSKSVDLMPDGFSDWFDLAREKGIVTASLPIDDQMCVCTNPEVGDWQPWTELAFAFPVRILREMNPIKFRFSQSESHLSASPSP